MDAEPPAAIWVSPTPQIAVERRFRLVAPYAAGGHRGIDLRISPGAAVRAPCRGLVTFRGVVGGGPPTLTITCGAGGLRATLGRVAATAARGASVRAGQRVGIATAAAIDLSARRPGGAYLDPLPLLRAPAMPVAPPVVARRAGRRPDGAERASRPAELPASAFAAAEAPSAAPTGARPTRRSAPAPAASATGTDPALVLGASLATLAAGMVGGTGLVLRARRRVGGGAGGSAGRVAPAGSGR